MNRSISSNDFRSSQGYKHKDARGRVALSRGNHAVAGSLVARGSLWAILGVLPCLVSTTAGARVRSATLSGSVQDSQGRVVPLSSCLTRAERSRVARFAS